MVYFGSIDDYFDLVGYFGYFGGWLYLVRFGHFRRVDFLGKNFVEHFVGHFAQEPVVVAVVGHTLVGHLSRDRDSSCACDFDWSVQPVL